MDKIQPFYEGGTEDMLEGYEGLKNIVKSEETYRIEHGFYKMPRRVSLDGSITFPI